jgi:serine/threonine protein kinase
METTRILNEWIHDITSDLSPAIHQREFEKLVLETTHHYLRFNTVCRLSLQLYTLAHVFVCSCFASSYPIPINKLQYACNDTYTVDEIVRATYRVCNWHGQQDTTQAINAMDVRTIRLVADHDHTICDLVSVKGTLYIRKRMYHDKKNDLLPIYSAMTELLTHYKLKGRNVQNVSRLCAFIVNTVSSDAFYAFVPHPLINYKSTVDVSSLLFDIAIGLRGLHTAGVAHRDIKPGNIQVSKDKVACIIDLGAAGYGQYRTTTPSCTITHRPPDMLEFEIYKKKNDIYQYSGQKLDIWSFGVLAAEMYIGHAPFGVMYANTTERAALLMIQTGLPLLEQKLRHLVSSEHVDILIRCMDLEPHNRPTIQEVIAVLCNTIDTIK